MRKSILLSLMTVSFALISSGICAQVNVDVNEKVNNEANDRANQNADAGVNAGFDAAENGVKSLFKKKDKEAKQEKETENKENKASDDAETKVSTENAAPKQTVQPSLSSYSKFDFVPGEKVIFYEDFSQDALADFPALWNTNGSGEVTTTNLYPGRWFKMKPGGAFMPELTIPFNENFTFECDLIFKDAPTSSSSEGFDINFIAASPEWKIGENIDNGCAITINGSDVGVSSWKDGNEFFASARQGYSTEDMTTKLRISIWIQKQRMRFYVNDAKVLDLPRLFAPGLTCNKLQFYSSSYEGNNSLMANVRVAYGAPDTRNKLITVGKLVTYGIIFDVNSDKIKPESYGTLKDIASVLKENVAVKIKIIGHTDGDGDAAKNLDLSKRRAISVKNELSKNFGIEASRIETDGKGKTAPIAPNDTPANKAQNRRVEIIKL